MSNPHKKRKLNVNTNPSTFNIKDFEIYEAAEGETEDEYDSEIDNDINNSTFQNHKHQSQSLYNKRIYKETNPLIPIPNKSYNPINNILDEMKQSNNSNNTNISNTNTKKRNGVTTINNSNTNNMAPKIKKNKRRNRPKSLSPTPINNDNISNTCINRVLPSIKDPNLWLLKCKKGAEEFAVDKLLENKDRYQYNQQKRLYIYDAFITDTNNGYIYVQSDKKFHVELACKDINCLYPNKIKLVPLNERSAVLRMRDTIPNINNYNSETASHVPFIIGEKVKVINGALINLRGTVTTIKDMNNITIQPQHKQLNEQVFSSHELIKIFEIGCYVKVIGGKYKNETGSVVKICWNKNTVLICNKMQSKSMCINVNDITEIPQPILSAFDLYDFVDFGMDKCGVIINIKNNELKILDIKEQINICRSDVVSNVSKSQHKHIVAFDRYNNEINIGDIVMPHFGIFKYKKVTVKHIYNSILFCYSKLCHINAGIFVIKSKHCMLCGGGDKNNIIYNYSNSFANKKRLMRNNKWISKQVKITKGLNKGMIGIVCGGNDKKVHIKLHSKNKTININVDHIKIVDGCQRKSSYDAQISNNNNMQMEYGSNTPAYNAYDTPIHQNNNDTVWNPYYSYR